MIYTPLHGSTLKNFASLKLAEPLLRAVKEAGYETPTPIQAQAIPPLIEGKDVLGCAQTGTGKTAAFALPVLDYLLAEPTQGRRVIRALILSPTRELAAQIEENFKLYAKHTRLRHLVIFGGVNQNPQVRALKEGIDILVATPGRLLDLHGQGYIKFNEVEFFVLDEADRMLDMGFLRDIKRLLKVLPEDRQNLLFSATMPPDIAKLARTFMHEPVRIDITPPSSTVESIDQTVMFVDRADKKRLLADLLKEDDVEQSIVFTRTKHGANRLVKQLDRAGIAAAAIHGNKSQNARKRALSGFRDGTIPVLVATDIASRGIDVEGVSHVFNYDLPNEPESYVHRIGRTGRAGRSGVAIAFCDPTEGEYLRDIERLTGQPIPVDTDHEYHCEEAVPPPAGARRGRKPSRPKQQPSQNRRSQNSRRPPRQQQQRRSSESDESRQDRPKPSQNAEEGQAPPKRRRRRRRSPAPGDVVKDAPRPSQPKQGSSNSQGGEGSDGPPKRRRRRRRRSGPRPEGDKPNQS